MANKTDRLEINQPGKFYVDTACIDCHICQSTAPENFARDDSGDISFVKKQPTDEVEFQLCMDALESCPVEAIGSDGDS